MAKVPKEILQAQYIHLNNEIEQKEKELKDFNPANFVLNKNIAKVIEELKILNDQRAELAALLEKTEG